jgi:hypothetical protein
MCSAVKSGPDALENLENAVEREYPCYGKVNPQDACKALISALEGLRKYSPEDLGYLASRGFQIHGSVIPLSEEQKLQYMKLAGEIALYLPYEQKIDDSTVVFLGEMHDVLKIGSKALSSYAEIFVYEAKAREAVKIDALQVVLEGQAEAACDSPDAE